MRAWFVENKQMSQRKRLSSKGIEEVETTKSKRKKDAAVDVKVTRKKTVTTAAVDQILSKRKRHDVEPMVEAAPVLSKAKRKSKEADVTDVLDESSAKQMCERLLAWYSGKKRPLPWRGSDPYGVWVSEIMCQQTKVDTVIPYYNKWMERFPTVVHLAESSLDEVNSLWAGLGYYRRAKFLHEGALKVTKDFDGKLPQTKAELLDIKGIGDYTSSAIASICYKERVPAVDGNVIRVFSRLKAVSLEGKDKALQRRATEFASSVVKWCSEPGELNQSMMELGAIVCTPRKPKCKECPIADMCCARDIEDGDVDAISDKYPARPTAKAPVPEKHVFIAVVIGANNSVLATKRPSDGGLLASQWELVCVEKDSATELTVRDLGAKLRSLGACGDCTSALHEKSVGTYKHVFSHLKHIVTPFVYDLSLCKTRCLIKRTSDEKLKWIPKPELRKAGLTRSMTKALELCGLLLK